jgi:virginiamycin B lyase
LWFTLNAAASVGRVDDDGAVMVLPLALEGAAPVGIASGPSGVWFADIMGDRIGHIDADGTITAVALNAGAKPHAVVADGSGGCWFTEWGGNRIGHVNAAGEVSGHDLPVEGSEPHGIAIAPDGTVWAALEIGQLVGFES